MKKILLLCLALLMMTACGKKTDTSVNPLGSGNLLTTATSKSIQTTSATTKVNEIQTTTAPARKKYSLKKEMFIDVPYYSQKSYPTGCELVSTSMLLAFYGFEIKAGNIIKDGYLEAVDFKEEKDDKKKVKYGGDPNEVFIGNPEKNTGYGCHSGAIMLALREYLTEKVTDPDKQYMITDLSGMELEEICQEYINKEIPVLVWASINMNPTFYKLRNSWIIEETGERYFWKSNEHCLVLVGYDKENYYFNDPLIGKNTPYMKRLVERRYGEMGMQAVALIED
ncbi:MAG: C39 family peptidase [Ruminococcus sp.]|nr:C39 family peptidase [Ruminococcus sp.]